MQSKYITTNEHFADFLAQAYVRNDTFTADFIDLASDLTENTTCNPANSRFRRMIEQHGAALDPDNITKKQLGEYLVKHLEARMELEPDYAVAVLLDLYDRSPQYLDDETVQFIEANTYINENWKEHPWSDPAPRREFIDL
ncbi:MAG: hypothetical protein ACRECY_12055 [Phyllobacterium sp.]